MVISGREASRFVPIRRALTSLGLVISGKGGQVKYYMYLLNLKQSLVISNVTMHSELRDRKIL